jgi:acid phosphatase
MRYRTRFGVFGALASVTLLLVGCGSAAQHNASGTSGSAPPVLPSTALSATTSSAPQAGGSGGSAPSAWRPAHVVIAVLENHPADEVLDPKAPFLTGLARQGAVMTRFYAITHPSEPNYQALFSGSTQGVTGDPCPVEHHAPNLAASLLAARYSFAGYAEGLPSVGSTACYAQSYDRNHVPWADYPDLPATLNRPFTDFPSDYSKLPTVSFVIPNLDHDMHNGTLQQADNWLQHNLGGYAAWAPAHDSLLVITTDEDDGSADNRVATVLYGAHVVAGRHDERVTLYSLLRLIEDLYGLPRIGASATAAPITGALRR